MLEIPTPVVNSSSASRPRIAISGGDGDSKSVAAIVTQIRTAGAEPIVIVDHADRLKRGDTGTIVAQDLADVDALIVMGNNGDINPAKYGQQKHEKTNIETNPARAEYEETALKKALEMKMPVLGICGGMQRLNILDHAECGGTLMQHVPDAVGDNHHAQQDGKIPPFVPVQFVQVEDDTALAAIAGSLPGLYTPQHAPLPPGVVMENSMHHQAVDRVHKDFRVAARSEDGIIEAIEPKVDGRYAGQFVMGVQWHPEFGASDLGPKLAVRLVEEARAFAQAKGPRQQEAATEPVTILGPMAAQILRQRQNAVMHRQAP